MQVSSNQFTGTLPSAWFTALSALTHLNISDLSGGVDLKGHEVIYAFKGCTTIVETSWAIYERDSEGDPNLSTEISGTLPVSWTAFSTLKELVLADMPKLIGAIPTNFSVMTGLHVLVINTNSDSISGSLPAEYSALTGLTVMGLAANPGLTGTLPEVWGQSLSTLVVLNISKNRCVI